jgi:hypothetical protein
MMDIPSCFFGDLVTANRATLLLPEPKDLHLMLTLQRFTPSSLKARLKIITQIIKQKAPILLGIGAFSVLLQEIWL